VLFCFSTCVVLLQRLCSSASSRFQINFKSQATITVLVSFIRKAEQTQNKSILSLRQQYGRDISKGTQNQPNKRKDWNRLDNLDKI
jgi:hypothetical protein